MKRNLGSYLLALATALTAASRAEGVVWSRAGDNPILTESNDPGWYDSGYIAGPKIVYDRDTSKYFMYYTGCTDAERINRESIGLATADRLDGPWTKYASPNDRHALFAPGFLGSFYYSRNWGSGTIVQTGSHSWEMWTVGSSTPDIRPHAARVGYATSADGYNWTMHEGPGYGGSVFEDFNISSSGIGAFAVLKEDETYRAWYTGLYATGIQYATSTDGIDWQVAETEITGVQPVYTVDNVLAHGDHYYMTTSRADLTGIDIYRSSDGFDWELLDALSLEPSTDGWDKTRVYQAFLCPDPNAGLRLFYTGSDASDDTQSKLGIASAAVTLPEPGTIYLLLSGALLLLCWSRRVSRERLAAISLPTPIQKVNQRHVRGNA